jgi:hypothetical protein
VTYRYLFFFLVHLDIPCPAAGLLIYNQHAAANTSAIAFTAQVDNPAAINQFKGTQVSSGGLSSYLILNSKVILPVKLPT